MPHGQQQAENSTVVTHWCGGLVFVDEAQKAICGRKRIYLQVATYMDLYLKENVSTTFLLRNKRPFIPSKEAESRCLKGLTHKKDALLLIITPLQLCLVSKYCLQINRVMGRH